MEIEPQLAQMTFPVWKKVHGGYMASHQLQDHIPDISILSYEMAANGI